MKKQISVFFILLLMSITLLAGCKKQEAKQEKTQQQITGRYTERDVQLPAGERWQKMFLLSDGGYALYVEEKPLHLISADGTQRQVNYLWHGNFQYVREIECAVTMEGDMLLAYIPLLTKAEYEAQGDALTPIAYAYIDNRGNKRTVTPYGESFSEDMYPENMAFAPDGRLYLGDSQGKVFYMNTDTGEMSFLFQAKSTVQEFCFYGTTMIALDNTKAWLYDTEKNELLDGIPVLDEFVSSHQFGRKSIVLSAGREDENCLYIGCRTGLYRYVWDGSLIEQIADGRLLLFGDTTLTPQVIQPLEKDEFRVFFEYNRMVELYFDKSLPAKPERTLHVYSLEENAYIRYAAQLFQKEHSDVMVQYTTGMDGDNAISKEDALRKLNTELLADEEPDVMVMDGLDIEQYAKKGVLKKLDAILKPYVEDGLVFENIIKGMRMTEEESVYAIPMNVWLPCWLTDRKYLEGEENLLDIVEGLEKIREDHPKGSLLVLRNEEDLMKKLIFTSLPAWTQEDGGLDIEKLEEFFTAAARIWELNDQGMTEEDWEFMQRELALEYGWNDRAMMCAAASGLLSWREAPQHIWVQLGHIYYLYGCLETLHLCNEDANREVLERVKGVDMDLWWDTYHGQAQNVFIGRTLTGICEGAKEPELAEEFLHLLLSDTLMEKYWLGKGIPISKQGIAARFDIENTEYGQYLGWTEDFIQNNYIEAFWPNEKEQQHFLDMMENAAVFYQPGTVLEEAAMEVGIQVLKEELTPEEGAKEVQRKMAIEMEE